MNYLVPFLTKDITYVADVGSGPNALKTCEFANGKRVVFTPMDKQDFKGVEKQDMENLTYPDNHFDIVQCINALDHTKDARKALDELIRVSADLVYIDCNLYQKRTSGGWHYWDANESGALINGTDIIQLHDWGFDVHYYASGGEPRYDRIVATLRKRQQ